MTILLLLLLLLLRGLSLLQYIHYNLLNMTGTSCELYCGVCTLVHVLILLTHCTYSNIEYTLAHVH